jgi:5-methylthioadenosine/S-adenosylhomocysteine deaminase
VLQFATLDGAHVCGLEDVTGSLTPGKKADVVVIDGKAPNVAPVIDPVAAVVLSADVSNVDTVIVNGKVLKRDGRILGDVDRARRLSEDSRDYLVSKTERDANWTVPATR